MGHKTGAEKVEAIKMKQGGASCGEIAKEIGVSGRTVNNWINSADALLKKCGFNDNDIVGGWIKGDDFSLRVKKEKSNADIAGIIAKAVENVVTPVYQELEKSNESNNLLVLPFNDIHVGKVAYDGEKNDFNRIYPFVINAVKSMIRSSNPDKVLIVVGGDLLNVDNKNNTTTGGTGQDNCMTWDEAIEDSVRIFSYVIQYLIDEGLNVEVMHTQGNHDYHLGYMTCKVLEAKFKDVSFIVNADPINMITWGDYLIASTHSDGLKLQKLEGMIPLIAREKQLSYKHAFCFTEHLHHRTQKDMIGLTVKGLRSIAPTDQWHLEKGFVGSPKSLEFFVIDKKLGEKAQYTFTF